MAPAWRGTGLAARLLGEAEIMARQWGLGLVTLHVQRDDWQPLRFYQKQTACRIVGGFWAGDHDAAMTYGMTSGKEAVVTAK